MPLAVEGESGSSLPSRASSASASLVCPWRQGLARLGRQQFGGDPGSTRERE